MHEYMKRIPEQHELMDDYVEVQAYAEMDFSGPHNMFIAQFQKLFPDFSEGLVLDIGCGNADPTIRFANAYPNTQLYGLDGSAVMLSFAEKAVAKAGLSERIEFEQGTLQKYSGKSKVFDAIICNSVLHHIEPVDSLWTGINMLAKKGAPVLVMDFFRPLSRELAETLVDLHAKDSPEELRTRGFYNSLLAAFTSEEVRVQLDKAGLSAFQIQVISDRHMIIFGRT